MTLYEHATTGAPNLKTANETEVKYLMVSVHLRLFPIFLPKIIRVVGNLTKSRQKQFCLFLSRPLCLNSAASVVCRRLPPVRQSCLLSSRTRSVEPSPAVRSVSRYCQTVQTITENSLLPVAFRS